MKIEIGRGVGANLASVPILCGSHWVDLSGSHHSTDKCFSYIEGEWQHFATMIKKRAVAAGIVYNNSFHIFGGLDANTGDTPLKSSEIVNADGSTTEGPELPVTMLGHGISFINTTVSIITGGHTNGYTDKTWYFNHATQEFRQGPNLLESRRGHAYGTIVDQETKENIAIVAGGYSEPGGYRDSTEIFMNGQWVTGR